MSLSLGLASVISSILRIILLALFPSSPYISSSAMQSSSLILRRAALSASLRAPAPVAVRHISTSRALFDDSAKDSVKRAAKNVSILQVADMRML